MIRWRFLLVRALIVGALLMALRLGLGPVAKYVTVQAIQSATGARVDVQGAQVGLFPPRVRLSGIQVGDPREGKAMRDAFRADAFDLVIDGKALLHRRWVVRSGRLTGLQIDARRDTSGHLPSHDPLPSEQAQGPSMFRRLLTTTTDSLRAQATALTEDLETVRRSHEIREHWKSEHDALIQRARALEKRIRDIRERAKGIDNPLRDWPELQETLAEARTARDELVDVRRQIDALPGRLEKDLQSLQEAKQIDLARVDQHVPIDLTESNDLGVELLTRSVREQLQRLRGYVDSGRELASYTVVAPESERQRGVDHDLAGGYRPPQMMLRHLEINGQMRAGGETYDITGILNHWTPTPQRLREPTRVRMRLEGPQVVRVDYVRDRRQGRDAERLTLHLPQAEARPMRLGDDDAGISIAGGTHELWIQLHSQHDRLQGRLVSKRSGLRLRLNSPRGYADSPAAVSLSDSLASIDQIEVDAHFKGTWQDLDLRLRTNLGHALGEAARQAVAEQVQASKQQLIARIHEVHLEQTEKLRQWLDSQQSEARELLASADASIEAMSQQVIREVGGGEAYLGSLRSAIQTPLR